MSAHLGYDKHDPIGRMVENSRNGSSPKTVRTEIGDVTIAVPRDRDGSFEPMIVRKHQRRLAGLRLRDIEIIDDGSFNEIPFEEIEDYLDLVTVSIASDVVPVTGEYRIISSYGLKIINTKLFILVFCISTLAFTR